MWELHTTGAAGKDAGLFCDLLELLNKSYGRPRLSHTHPRRPTRRAPG